MKSGWDFHRLRWQKALILAFANFYGVNIPTMANFELMT